MAHTGSSRMKQSTRVASILIVLAFLVPVGLAGFVDDSRLGGFIGTPVTEPLLDWEPGEVQVLTNSVADAGNPQVVNATATVDNTTIAGESSAIITDYAGAGVSGVDRESVAFYMPVSRASFLDSDATGMQINWSRDDVPDGANDISIAYVVSPTSSACTTGLTSVVQCDDFHFIETVAIVFDEGGQLDIDIEISDLININNLAETPTNGQDFIFVIFLDTTLGEDVTVVMDAQITGPSGVFTLSLDQFGFLLVLLDIGLLFAVILQNDQVTFEGLRRRGRRGRSRGVDSMNNAMRNASLAFGTTLAAVVALTGLVSAGTLNDPAAATQIVASIPFIIGVGTIVVSLIIGNLQPTAGRDFQWAIVVGLIITIVAVFALNEFVAFFDLVFNSGLNVLTGATNPTTFGLGAAFYTVLIFVAFLQGIFNILIHRTLWA